MIREMYAGTTASLPCRCANFFGSQLTRLTDGMYHYT